MPANDALPFSSSLADPRNVLRVVHAIGANLQNPDERAKPELDRFGFRATSDPDVLFSEKLHCWIATRPEQVTSRLPGVRLWVVKYRSLFIVWTPAANPGLPRLDRIFLEASTNRERPGRLRFRTPARYAPDSILYRNAFRSRR